MRELKESEFEKVHGGILPILATLAGGYAGAKLAKWVKKVLA